jgi:hypothetical protein
MPSAQIREFSMPYEIDKLKKILLLPITNILFDEKYEYGVMYLNDDMDFTTIYASLYVNDYFIGTTPYVSTRLGIGYLSCKPDELDWEKVYKQFQQVIFDKIVQQEPLTDSVEIRGFMSLFIKDKIGSIIKIAFCNYIEDEWNVVVSGLDVEERVKVVTVILSPPPFDLE